MCNRSTNNHVVFVESYSQLPVQIQNKLKEANLFYSRQYEAFAHRVGFYMLYLYNANYIASVDVYTVYQIQFGILSSEVYALKESNESPKHFLDECMIILKNCTKLAWIASGTAALFDYYPTNSQHIPFGSYLIDLTLPEETLWQNVHRSHRNCINYAKRNGMVLKIGGCELISDYLLLDRETWQRSNQEGYNSDLLENFIQGLKDCSCICIVYNQDVPQAGACYYYNKAMTYNLYAASANYIKKGAMKFMHWEMIRYFKLMGVQTYNFIGYRFRVDPNSKHQGIQEFKRLFGPTLFQGYMFRTILKPSYRTMFQCLYQAENGEVFQDTIDLEAYKWDQSDSFFY